MKQISTYTMIFLLCSCTANYHLNKAIKKGYRCDSVADTIRITAVDSFPVIVDNKIVYEYYHTTKDTIVRYNTSYVPVTKTRWQTRIEYKLKRDTIRQTQRIEVAKYKSEKKSKANIWLFVMGFGLGLFTKYLFQYAKKAL
jgi:hypothetical protein